MIIVVLSKFKASLGHLSPVSKMSHFSKTVTTDRDWRNDLVAKGTNFSGKGPNCVWVTHGVEGAMCACTGVCVHAC